MQELELNKIAACLSRNRLAKYGNNLAQAVANYKWNLELSESFYPLLNAAAHLRKGSYFGQS